MGDVAPEIKVGDAAPDFTLKDQDQKDVKLSDFKGKKNVVLAFYPLDWSPVCTGENKCLTDDFPKFGSANAELIKLLSRYFDVPKRNIELVSGETSRVKKVRVSGLNELHMKPFLNGPL